MPDLKNVPPSPRPRRLSQLKDAWKNKRSVTIVYLLLRASVILVLIAQIFNRNFENVFLCVLTLFLFGVPNMVQHRLDIALPSCCLSMRRKSWARLTPITLPSPIGIPCCTP